MQEMSDEEFDTNVNSVKTIISEKDKNLTEEFERYWRKELVTHAYQFDRQNANIALLATLTKAELQAYFEQLLFQDKRANRFDMHWNSQLHINQA